MLWCSVGVVAISSGRKLPNCKIQDKEHRSKV